MVNTEILEGLRTALSRGYSLEQAMMSFYNSGYKKEEIEEAAKALYSSTHNKPVQQKPTQEPAMQKPTEKKFPQVQVSKEQQRAIPQKVTSPMKKSTVSTYEAPKKSNKTTTIILLISLLFLLGLLSAIFIFRDELINFLNGIF